MLSWKDLQINNKHNIEVQQCLHGPDYCLVLLTVYCEEVLTVGKLCISVLLFSDKYANLLMLDCQEVLSVWTCFARPLIHVHVVFSISAHLYEILIKGNKIRLSPLTHLRPSSTKISRLGVAASSVSMTCPSRLILAIFVTTSLSQSSYHIYIYIYIYIHIIGSCLTLQFTKSL